MTLWMQIGWAQVGVEEIAGARANQTIVDYFREIGRPDITSDEIHWCAVAHGYCLKKAGVSLDALTPTERMRAISYLKIGTPLPLDRPRVGATVVLKRPGGHHVGHLVGWTKTHVQVLGGNQANAYNVKSFPRSAVVGFRWPGPPATPKEVAASGSRIATAARQQQLDSAKTIGVETLGQAVPPAPPPSSLPAPGEIARNAGEFQSVIETMSSFANFVWAKWPWIALGVALYFLLRVAWNGWRISWWRADDANTGAHQGRAASPAAEPEIAEAADAETV